MNKRLLKKAFRDLFHDKQKALVSISAILIGMIAFGTLLFSYEIITNELITTYSSINPPSASININKVDNHLLKLTKNFSEIKEFEIKAQYQMRGQKANGEWTTVELFATDNYTNLDMNKVFYMEGKSNPDFNEMLIERDAIKVSGKSLGESLVLTLPNGKETELKITGMINDLGVHPATMHNTIYAYVSIDTLKTLGLTPNRIDFKISKNTYDHESILVTSNTYMRLLEKNGYQIKKLLLENTPGISMHLEEYKTALFLLRTFSFVAFLFGCLIMGSLITAILSQQVKQIGILKTFGTKNTSILYAYLLAIFSFVGLAGILSLPLAKWLANFLSAILLRISNMSLTHTQVSPSLYIIFLLVCFMIPLFISFFSIQRAAKITIKEAISDSGDNNNYMKKPFLPGLTWIQRPILLTLRNALRRKGRFSLNVMTLTISGVCFITILVCMVSVSTTLSDNINQFNYDYRFLTGNKETKEIKQLLSENPEIGAFEYWGFTSGKFIYKNGQIGKSYSIFAIPEGSKLVTPDLLAGNWLQNEKNGIVVGHEFLQNYPDISLGDTINIEVDGTALKLPIIGVVKDFSGTNIFMNKNFYTKNISSQSKQNLVQVQLDSNLRGRSRKNLINKLEASLLDQGVSVLQSETKANAIKVLNSHYMSTFQTFLIIIFMILIVSAFGLSSTTNVQTLERMKEIGIMKAFGTDKKQIIRIITSESMFVSISSWILAAILSIPSIIVGHYYFSATTLEVPITLNIISVFISYVVWLMLVLLVGKQASKQAALKAANMTVKDSLLFR